MACEKRAIDDYMRLNSSGGMSGSGASALNLGFAASKFEKNRAPNVNLFGMAMGLVALKKRLII